MKRTKKDTIEKARTSVQSVKEAHFRDHQVLRDYLRTQIEIAFTGLNNQIGNDVSNLRGYIEAVYALCTRETKSMLDGFKSDIDELIETRKEINAGALLVSQSIDLTEEHLKHISVISGKIDKLIGIDRQLDKIRQKLDKIWVEIDKDQ